MISARNLLLPSSGNKTIIFILLFALTFASCDLFTKVQKGDTGSKDDKDELDEIQGKRVYDPETGDYIIVTDVTEKMDTVIWRTIPPSSYPPITSEGILVDVGGNPIDVGEHGTEFLSEYNVSLLLPFMSNRFSGEAEVFSNVTNWSLHFYGGIQLAFDILNQEGVRLNVSVLDSKGSTSEVRSLLSASSDLKAANLIIGPVKKECIQQVATFSQRNKIPFVSPYSAEKIRSTNNPFYVQVSPSLKTHCEAITHHVKKRYDIDQVVLVCRNKSAEIERLKFFQDANFLIEGTTDTSMFEEYIVQDETPDFKKMDVKPLIRKGKTTVFIVPSYSNETFVYSFLRQINLAKGNNNVVVYGMPRWMQFEKIDYDYYEKLNVHISENVYLNPVSAEIGNFKRKFFDRFGMVPNQEAYIGYDVMLYFGRMLQKNGTMFQYKLDQEFGDYLHTRFHFERDVAPSSAGAENLNRIDQFENKYVNILKFGDYQFQLAD